MGNNDTRSVIGEWGKSGAVFHQSVLDFPCTVVLGSDTPSFGLKRFKQGLRFIPPDDEGFTLRGDKRRLFYKGRKRSHRFTILGDSSFEYDCILLKEPESNVISLCMEGAENYDFFRQPDFVKEPFLKGSYAVYKKDTLIGEGTGKLCHIHRPQIIDARGRKCWGELSVVGSELRITIPEWFLSEAKYPIVVDPTVGTTTVGSLSYFEEDEREYYFEIAIPVNRFLISGGDINGLCTAYIYTNDDDGSAYGRPVFYSDNNNVPQNRKSTEEEEINLRVINGKPKGWRTGTFRSNGIIANNTYIWFGVFANDMWYPRYDFGSKCYVNEYDYNNNGSQIIPNTYPMFNSNWYENFKLSMYFTYTLAQNYVKTLTQGVKLSDTRKLTGSYKRTVSQTVKVNSTLKRLETFIRKCVVMAQNSMSISRSLLFLRKVTEQIKLTMSKNEKMAITRKCNDVVRGNTNIKKFQNLIRLVKDSLKILVTQSFYSLFVRSVNDTAIVTDFFRHFGSFVRGLFLTVGSNAETAHTAVYKRKQADIVQTEGKANRGLLFFIRLVSQVFFRDYLLRRFLIAKDELVIKSAISREINLESRID